MRFIKADTRWTPLFAVLLLVATGCGAQFKETPESDRYISCREQGFTPGSLAFANCLEGGVETIRP